MTSATLEYLVKVQDRDLKELRSQLRSSGKDAEEASKSHSTLGSVFGGVAKAAVGLGAAYVGLDAVKSVIEGGEKLKVAQDSLSTAIAHTGGNVAKLMPVYNASAQAAAQFGIDQASAMQSLAQATLLTGSAEKAQRAYQEALVISKATGKDLSSVLIATSKAQDGNTGSLGRYGVQLSKTASSQDQFNTIMGRFGGQAQANTTPVEQLRAHLSNLEQEIGAKLVPVIDSAITFITDHWPQISAVVGAVVSGIGTVIHTVLEPLFVNVVIPIFKAVVDWVRQNWPQIKTIIETVIQDVRTVITTVLGTVESFWKRWGSTIMSVVKTTFETIFAIIRNLVKVVEGVFNLIDGLIHGRWGQVWNGAKQIVTGVFGAIFAYLKGIVSTFFTVASAIGKALLNGIIDALKGIGSALEHAIIDPIKHVLGKAGSLLSKIPGASSVGHALGSVVGSIFGAEGAIVGAPTVALIGEAGPEAVVPLSRIPGNRQLPPNLSGSGYPNAIGGDLTVNLTVDGQVLARVVYANFLQMGKRNALALPA